MTAVVGSARTDDGHDHRQGTTFARADVYHPTTRGESRAHPAWKSSRLRPTQSRCDRVQHSMVAPRGHSKGLGSIRAEREACGRRERREPSGGPTSIDPTGQCYYPTMHVFMFLAATCPTTTAHDIVEPTKMKSNVHVSRANLTRACSPEAVSGARVGARDPRARQREAGVHAPVGVGGRLGPLRGPEMQNPQRTKRRLTFLDGGCGDTQAQTVSFRNSVSTRISFPGGTWGRTMWGATGV